ncbi:hypothetical protein B0E33_19080 [Roseibium algicola]|uniref:DUF4365 domain-containing protein n=1 Tax=Roseibium algicola TaxID=2857014 RepID=A0ABM6I4S7_9HYPH|nr:DUF4365 domain-containing protein [Roseibium aggregatum]AQQ05416.1 hypothetical protein B0E33_19080 [Roseibium aggregatum]
MSKRITDSQLIGEIGESAAKTRFLNIGFQFDGRSRLEAGIDGIAEVMDDGTPLAKMIAVQVKARDKAKYSNETDEGFTYLLRTEDLHYWRNSNLPVILVLYRRSDETFYWKEIPNAFSVDERKLVFDKNADLLNHQSADSLAQLTVPKAGHGYYVPPLGGGEEALVNMLPIKLPNEIFVASTPYTSKQAMAILFDGDESPRFDWAIKGRTFWSFHDPREECTAQIVDEDQVEAIETSMIAFHEDINEQNNFSFLLKQVLRHQFGRDLGWDKERKIFYFLAEVENQSRVFKYQSTVNRAEADVVNAVKDKKDEDRIAFVRHHAFSARFELMLDQWFLILSPTYHFTTNGFIPHSYPAALLAGKKRLDNNASLRGQVIMWHRFLSGSEVPKDDLFGSYHSGEKYLGFGPPPSVSLPTTVPEKAWASSKSKKGSESEDDLLEGLQLD